MRKELVGLTLLMMSISCFAGALTETLKSTGFSEVNELTGVPAPLKGAIVCTAVLKNDEIKGMNLKGEYVGRIYDDHIIFSDDDMPINEIACGTDTKGKFVVALQTTTMLFFFYIVDDITIQRRMGRFICQTIIISNKSSMKFFMK
jgi:hypothetical protein